MSGTVKLVYSISKEAMKMIKAGEAVLQSGGVRSLTGQLIEMAKPSLASTLKASVGGLGLGPVGAAVNIASSLANNVQSGILQHSVNVANAKLDVVVQQLSALTNTMQGLKQVHVLSWVNSAFSLANCGISVAGFYMTMNKLGQIQGRLGQFFDLYKRDRESKLLEDYRDYLTNLKNHLGYLQKRNQDDTLDRQTFLQWEAPIAENLTHAENFLRTILSDFQDKSIDGKLGCEIIFSLSTIYAQTVNEFCCQYFYIHGVQHHMFHEWISVLDEIDSPAFREFLKRYFTFDREYISVPPRMKQAAHYVLFESVCQQKNRLMLCADAIKQLPEEQYAHLDDLLIQEVSSMLSDSLPELQGIDIDETLAQRLEANQYWCADDGSIFIPPTL